METEQVKIQQNSCPDSYLCPFFVCLINTLCCCCCCCCCCCQITSVVSDSVRPHRWQPTRLPLPWDSPAKNIGVGCHFLLQCLKVKSESEVTQSCPTRETPWTAAHQAPPSTGFSRQKYWSRVPLPSLRTNPREYQIVRAHLNTRPGITQPPVAPCAGHLI